MTSVSHLRKVWCQQMALLSSLQIVPSGTQGLTDLTKTHEKGERASKGSLVTTSSMEWHIIDTHLSMLKLVTLSWPNARESGKRSSAMPGNVVSTSLFLQVFGGPSSIGPSILGGCFNRKPVYISQFSGTLFGAQFLQLYFVSASSRYSSPTFLCRALDTPLGSC